MNKHDANEAIRLGLDRPVDEIEFDNDPSVIDGLTPFWEINTVREWLVDEIVPLGNVLLLTGDAGVGKSTFVLSLSAAVAHGHRFLGREVKRGRVLYIDRENPDSIVRDRISRLGIDATPNLIIWGDWSMSGSRPVRPDGPDSRRVIEWARINRPLIIFDSLTAFLDGDEVNAGEVRRHIQLSRNLATAGATVILLHHVGKGEGARQYRGSTDFKASVDAAYLLETVGDALDGLSRLKLTPFKSRGSIAHPLRIDYVDGRFQESSDRIRTNRETVELLVAEHPGSSQTEIVKLAGAAGVANHRVRDLLTQGVQDGWLCFRVGPNNRKLFYPAELPEEGTLAA